MGFLEDAISKTKEVFDVARQKTNEVVVTEKQKFSLASLKNKREKDFALLGKIYFEKVKDESNIDTQTRNIIDSIIEKNKEIERINEEIQNIKNKRTCPNCNAYVDENSAFCNRCGIKFD